MRMVWEAYEKGVTLLAARGEIPNHDVEYIIVYWVRPKDYN